MTNYRRMATRLRKLAEYYTSWKPSMALRTLGNEMIDVYRNPSLSEFQSCLVPDKGQKMARAVMVGRDLFVFNPMLSTHESVIEKLKEDGIKAKWPNGCLTLAISADGNFSVIASKLVLNDAEKKAIQSNPEIKRISAGVGSQPNIQAWV